MCGIFGSKDRRRFKKLLQLNSERGTFATGIVSFYHNEVEITKKEGIIDPNVLDFASYYVGHVQAPTSSQREWEEGTSHPFTCVSWAVVHNGVLTNHEKLIEKYSLWNVNPVDTSVIPQLIQVFMEESGDLRPINSIKRVLEELEGTFALCIIDLDTSERYLARQGSILHISSNGDFSTLEFDNSELVKEGTLLYYSNDSWEQIDTFQTKSPFLFI